MVRETPVGFTAGTFASGVWTDLTSARLPGVLLFGRSTEVCAPPTLTAPLPCTVSCRLPLGGRDREPPGRRDPLTVEDSELFFSVKDGWVKCQWDNHCLTLFYIFPETLVRSRRMEVIIPTVE